MAKFIEVLKDGLTVQGVVRYAGERCQVRDVFPLKSKKNQTKKWGAPRYRQITEADFTGTGGEIVEDDAVAPVADPAGDAGEEAAAEATEVVTPEDKFAGVAGLNVEDTLLAVSGFSEEDLAEFIAFEQAGQARSGVLEPLGVGGE